ncbi:MAG TPA: diaminopimelate epimerase [Thermohalobaculum sp.]|nr:diaminopimelate epimerase [Thermohalobaculum sp.]
MDRRTPEQSPGLRFLKMHGLGNDFVIIDARGGADPVTPALARALGDRHRGVGFDQLAVIADADGAEPRVTFWNADGSTAGACGNASRCVAHLLMAESGAASLAMLTANGRLAADRMADGRIRVDMGAARTGWRDIPLAEAADTVSLPLPGAPGAVSMGNPHCVFFVHDAEAVPLAEAGPRWETHPLFPEHANVGFAQVLDRDAIRLRVWERGTGITLACGSGACAAVVAGVRKGLLERRVTVILDGGPLEIAYREDGHVAMAGPVSQVFEGRLSPGFVAGVRA